MEELTFNDILTNPSGRGSAAVARRSSIINDLSRRAIDLFKENRPSFEVFTGDDGVIVFHFKHKSEHDKYNVLYDTVLELTPNDSEKTERFISRYTVKMFSNIPSFMFTYAYVINQNGWLIENFEKHIGRKALNEEPKVRNPDEQMGFEKSIFFTAFYVRENNLTLVSKLNTLGRRLNWSTLVRVIPTSEEKLVEYNKAKSKVVAANKKKREEVKRIEANKKAKADRIKKASTRKRVSTSKKRR